MATIGIFTGWVNTHTTVNETVLTGTIAVTGGVAGVFAYILK